MFNFYTGLPPVDINYTSGIPRSILSTCCLKEAPGFYAEGREVLGFLLPTHLFPEILPYDVIITSTATIGYTTQ